MKRYRDYGVTYVNGGPAKKRRVMVSAQVAPQAVLVRGIQKVSYRRRAASASGLPEKKFFDTALSFAFDATGEVPATGQLALIPQGDTESTRDGRKASVKSIQIRGVIQSTPAAAATFASWVYMYLVLDTQANGAAAAVTDVFTSNVLATAMLNLNNSGRFRILKRWAVYMRPEAGVTTAYNTSAKQIEFYKQCDIPIDWSGASGAITEIRSNNLFLLAGSDTATDDTIGFTGTCRLRFMG